LTVEIFAEAANSERLKANSQFGKIKLLTTSWRLTVTSQLIPVTNRKRCLVYSIAVAAFGILLAPCAKTQTTWKVTVDVESGNDTPAYTVLSIPAGASNCAGQNPTPAPSAENLYICPGDTVEWFLKTKGKKGTITIHQRDGFLTKGGVPTDLFRASEGHSDGGTSDVNAPPHVYDYCVAVFDYDPPNSHLYAHDPKVIIGTGSPVELLDGIQRDCRQLLTSLRDNPTAAEQAKKMCEESQKLKILLHLQ
jgi:hypothetical protein